MVNCRSFASMFRVGASRPPDISNQYAGRTMPNSMVYVDDSPIHGKGLFAMKFIPAGQLIGTVRGKHTLADGDYVLWIDSENGFRVECELRYINHSSNPNAVYYDTLEVCAVRDIHPGEEITHNYEQGQEI